MNKKGVVFLGPRETGKTTRLWNIFLECIERNKKILIIDSATEHTSKSLLRKIEETYDDILNIVTYSEKEIVFPDIDVNAFVYELIRNKEHQIFLCDASYFLERSYDFPEGTLREQKRLLYKKFSMQVICALLTEINVIIMDEIELIPESKEVLQQIFSKDIDVYMSLHYVEGLAGLTDMFIINETDTEKRAGEAQSSNRII
jgi:predicted AAA+ superfamily ATPase